MGGNDGEREGKRLSAVSLERTAAAAAAAAVVQRLN